MVLIFKDVVRTTVRSSPKDIHVNQLEWYFVLQDLKTQHVKFKLCLWFNIYSLLFEVNNCLFIYSSIPVQK